MKKFNFHASFEERQTKRVKAQDAKTKYIIRNMPVIFSPEHYEDSTRRSLERVFELDEYDIVTWMIRTAKRLTGVTLIYKNKHSYYNNYLELEFDIIGTEEQILDFDEEYTDNMIFEEAEIYDGSPIEDPFKQRIEQKKIERKESREAKKKQREQNTNLEKHLEDILNSISYYGKWRPLRIYDRKNGDFRVVFGTGDLSRASTRLDVYFGDKRFYIHGVDASSSKHPAGFLTNLDELFSKLKSEGFTQVEARKGEKRYDEEKV